METNKIKIYSEKHITINIDQDPINQLFLFDVQTSYSHQFQWVSITSNFSYEIMYLQLQNRTTTASEDYLHATNIKVPTCKLSSTEVFIE